MTTENIDPKKTPAPEVATEAQDTAPVAQSEELSKGELEEVAGGAVFAKF